MTSGAGSVSARRSNPLIWIITSYVAEGVPFAMVIWVAGTMFKDLGHSDSEITVSLASIGVVWSLKPLWAGFLDLFRTKKFIVIAAEIAMAVLFAFVAGALQLQSYFTVIIVLLWAVAVASATQDICVDGVYITSLRENEQARYIGVQGMAWNLGRIIAVSATVWLAGYLQAENSIDLRASWSVVLGATAGLMAGLAVFHAWFLPPGSQPARPDGATWRDTFASFQQSAIDFCDKPALWGMLSFVLFFRSAEGLLLVEAPLFMQGCLEDGGLQLSLQDKGLIDGTIGTLAVIVGGLLGGLFIAKYTLKRTLFVLALCVNIPNICFLYLAHAVSVSGTVGFGTIAFVVGFEKFWYGFGFVGNMLYMMQQLAPGKYKMTHYAFATAMMNLVLVPTQMISGPLADAMGFFPYFAVVMVATIPSLIAAWLAPFPSDVDRPHKGEDMSQADPGRRLARRATAYALMALGLFLYVDTLGLGWLSSAQAGSVVIVILSVLAMSAVAKVALAAQAIRWGRASLASARRSPTPSPRALNSRGAIIAAVAMLAVSGVMGWLVVRDVTHRDWACAWPDRSAACQAPPPARKSTCESAVAR